MLKKKDLTEKQKEICRKNIVILDTYIYLSGSRYSINNHK